MINDLVIIDVYVEIFAFLLLRLIVFDCFLHIQSQLERRVDFVELL